MKQKTGNQKQENKNQEQMEQDLKQAQEAVLRAQADYQNLLRRTREEKIRISQMANMELILAILEPLDNLELACQQIDDAGLKMVIDQFKRTLEQFGVSEIDPEGQDFDVNTMEAVEKPSFDLAPSSSAGKQDKEARSPSNSAGRQKPEDQMKVIEVRKKGYQLNGVVIRHAKVVVG